MDKTKRKIWQFINLHIKKLTAKNSHVVLKNVTSVYPIL